MQSHRYPETLGPFLICLYFIALILFLGVILPGQGFSGDDMAFHTPAIALPFALSHPTRAIYHLLDLIFGIGLVLTATPLAQQLQNGQSGLVKAAIGSAWLGAALLLASGMIGFKGVTELARLYSQGQAEAGAAYLAITLITGALQMAAIFAFGGWVLLTSIAALKGGLPKGLAYLGLFAGAAALLNFAIEALSILTLVLGIVWATWLGVALLRQAK